MKKYILFLFIFLLIFMLSCDEEDELTDYTSFNYPVPDWSTGNPEDNGFDADLLEDVAIYAGENSSNCFLVSRNGLILGEWYWNGMDQETTGIVHSVTKSFTNAIVGIAQDMGYLNVNDKASQYISDWVGTESEDVTIKDILSNASGRHWDFYSDYFSMAIYAENKTKYAIDLPQELEPGEYWEYNNSAIQTLEEILNIATGMDVIEFATQYLFQPLGMDNILQRDVAGNPIMFGNAETTCRDMAKLGYLYLRKGHWSDSAQIVSEEWVEETTIPSTIHNDAYGYLWWLNYNGHWILASAPDRTEGDGQIIEGMPENSFAALGLMDQIIFVDPNTNMVFTRIGGAALDVAPASKDFVSELAQRLANAMN